MKILCYLGRFSFEYYRLLKVNIIGFPAALLFLYLLANLNIEVVQTCVNTVFKFSSHKDYDRLFVVSPQIYAASVTT